MSAPCLHCCGENKKMTLSDDAKAHLLKVEKACGEPI